MKFTRRVITTHTVEVRLTKAPKGKSYLLPIDSLERDNSRKEIFRRKHAFNDEGSVCAVLKKFYTVYVDNWWYGTFISKVRAVKCAKRELRRL